MLPIRYRETTISQNYYSCSLHLANLLTMYIIYYLPSFNVQCITQPKKKRTAIRSLGEMILRVCGKTNRFIETQLLGRNVELENQMEANYSLGVNRADQKTCERLRREKLGAVRFINESESFPIYLTNLLHAKVKNTGRSTWLSSCI